VWPLFLAGVVALVFGLSRAFPGAVRTRDDWGDVIYLIGFLAVLCAGALRARPVGVGRRLRYLAIWIAAAGVLALGYAYRDVLADAPQRLRLAFSSGDPVATGRRQLVIPQDEQGGYVVWGTVNGQRVRFLVDTGSSDTVLSPDDARRLGIDVDRLDYRYPAETANGKDYGAAYTAHRLQVGPIGLDDFRMAVNRAPMTSSLLGLSFLGRLESFEFRGRNLILTWK
jgi:aspartyl protease family protein